MRIFIFVFFLLPMAADCVGQPETEPAMTPIVDELKCEYSKTPLVIDENNPRFTWKLKNGACQKSFSIFISKDSAALYNGTWKAGPITSSRYHYEYDGPPLEPLTKYYWAVEIESCNGQSLTPAVSYFETGMKGLHNWKGSWISDGLDREHRPASSFKKNFQVRKEVGSVRCYIASAGLHMLSVNDSLNTTEFLNPIFTNFAKRIMYNTYDITDDIRPGENAVEVTLGNGWYNHQPRTAWNFSSAPWRKRPSFILNIIIRYADGDAETISTDASWAFSQSPFLFNGIYVGEFYDQMYASGSSSSPKQPVVVVQPPQAQIHAQNLPPIVRESVGHPVSFEKTGPATYLMKFTKNIAGVAEVNIPFMPDRSKLELTYGERISGAGVSNSWQDQYYFSSGTHGKFQTDVVVSSSGNFTFSPQFSYKGFEFLEIKSSVPVTLTASDVEAFAVHSNVAPAGRFESSSVLLNSIWTASNNSFLSNLVGYPTDCPHREKNGWTGDGHLTAELALFNFDMIKTYEKWMVDHRDAQRPSGELPLIIPTAGWGYEGNTFDWTCSAVMIPWSVYLFTGDSRIIEENYEMMQKFMEYWEARAGRHLLHRGLGDWKSNSSRASKTIISSAYYYEANRVMAKMAIIANDPKAASKYRENATKVREAVEKIFYSPANGYYAGGLQTEQAILLEFNMVPEDKKDRVTAHLLKSIRDSGELIDAGVIGAKAVPRALSMTGHADVAYRLATREEKPSWGYWVANGGTTLPESWWEEGGSKNHAYFGTISAWLYRVLGGINPVEDHPGFEKITFSPYIPPDLSFVKFAYESPRGQILSEWEKSDSKVLHHVKVPGNSTASYKIPAGYFYLGIENGSQPDYYRPRYDVTANTLTLDAGEYNIELGDSSELQIKQNILFDGQKAPVLQLNGSVASRQLSIKLSLETEHLADGAVVYELIHAYPSKDFFYIEGDTLVKQRPLDDPAESYQAIVKAYYYDRETGAPVTTEDYIGIGLEKEHTNIDFLLYPNPVDAVLTIFSDSLLPEAIKIRVYGSSGELWKEVFVGTRQNEVSLDVSDLQKGLYIIRFGIDGKLYNLKFLK